MLEQTLEPCHIFCLFVGFMTLMISKKTTPQYVYVIHALSQQLCHVYAVTNSKQIQRQTDAYIFFYVR